MQHVLHWKNRSWCCKHVLIESQKVACNKLFHPKHHDHHRGCLISFWACYDQLQLTNLLGIQVDYMVYYINTDNNDNKLLLDKNLNYLQAELCATDLSQIELVLKLCSNKKNI